MSSVKSEHIPPHGAISAAAFARNAGLSSAYVLRLCRAGRIFGARLHPLTRKWWIYPPAKLVPRP